jgi:hypothetical protein
MYIGEQLDFGVLGEVQSGLAGTTLVVCEGEDCVLDTAPGVHVLTTHFFYKQKVGL